MRSRASRAGRRKLHFELDIDSRAGGDGTLCAEEAGDVIAFDLVQVGGDTDIAHIERIRAGGRRVSAVGAFQLGQQHLRLFPE